MQKKLYPLKFHPILKEKIWGGTKLNSLLNKPSKLPNVGESWEISDVKGDASIVGNGELSGRTLDSLLKEYKHELVGGRVYNQFGNKFPLLIKFIDANQDLSIQLHPNDELAVARHNSFGKTEMWYVMQADANANLILGFNKNITAEDYLKHLEAKTLTEILNFEQVSEGDTFFIETGRIHAIGAGVMLAEIQQTSDITYRVYDWDRVDAHGNSRTLHNDLALEAINFEQEDNFKVSYPKEKNHTNKMVDCPYFTTNYLEIDTTINKQNNKDSFIIYMCVHGDLIIKGGWFEESLSKGETVLLPANIIEYQLISEEAKLLEVYV